MKRLNLYIGQSLLQTSLIGLGILTFVMVCGSFLQMFELLSRGISPGVLMEFIRHSLPYALGFTLPLAMLGASVIVFSRLSADQEITAMRASGISLWQIVAPGLVLAAAVCAVCFYLQGYLIPESRFRIYGLKHSGEIGNPIHFLEPGRVVQLPGCIVYVGDRHDETIEDVQLYILDDNQRISQDIHALRGTVSYDQGTHTVLLRLEQALFGFVGQSANASEVQRTRAELVEIPVRLADSLKGENLSRKPKYLSIRGLLSLANLYEQTGQSATPIYIQLHKRLVMSMAPMAFLLIGIPFGIRTKRSETVAGIVVSLALAMVFYIFIALADSLDKQDALHPEIFIWLPVVAYQAGGIWALKRIAAR